MVSATGGLVIVGADNANDRNLRMKTKSLARAALVGVVDANVNRIVKVAAEFLRLLLSEGVTGNDCNRSVTQRTLQY